MNNKNFGILKERLEELFGCEMTSEVLGSYKRLWQYEDYDFVNEAIKLFVDGGYATKHYQFNKLPLCSDFTPFLQNIKTREAKQVCPGMLPGYDPRLGTINSNFWRLIQSLLAAKYSGKLIEVKNRMRVVEAFCAIIKAYDEIGEVEHKATRERVIETICEIEPSLAVQVESRTEKLELQEPEPEPF